jgi:type I restriction enzyme, S subunit
LDLSEVYYVSSEVYQQRIARLDPQPGDVVYSREGGILGIACIIPSGIRVCLGQRMMLMRTNSEIYSSTLLMHVLNSPLILPRVRELTGGTASPHLNVKDIKAFRVPLLPIEEQQEIVRRVETLFAYADRLEARYTAARAQVERLTPALLAKAFRGELVPQDPNDEPAAVLLERIRAAREAAPTKPRPRKGDSQPSKRQKAEVTMLNGKDIQDALLR